jgi:hypothetical protein
MTLNKIDRDYYEYRGVRISRTKGGWTYRTVSKHRHDCVVPATLDCLMRKIDASLDKDYITVERGCVYIN